MNTIVIITSCFKYSHIWPYFFKLFEKYWSSCPYKSFLVTDKGDYKDISSIKIGKDLGWASNLKIGISKIKYNFEAIILLLEDYLLSAPVDEKGVLKSCEYLFKYDLGHVRMRPYHTKSKFGLSNWKFDNNYGIIRKDDNYCISIQPSVWKKQTLLKILIDGESAWDTEIKGSKRCIKTVSEDFISLKENQPHIFPYVNGMSVGKYGKNFKDFIIKEGFCD